MVKERRKEERYGQSPAVDKGAGRVYWPGKGLSASTRRCSFFLELVRTSSMSMSGPLDERDEAVERGRSGGTKAFCDSKSTQVRKHSLSLSERVQRWCKNQRTDFASFARTTRPALAERCFADCMGFR